MPTDPRCSSWEEADKLLGRVGQIDGELARAKTNAEDRIRPIQEGLAAVTKPLDLERGLIVACLETFCLARRGEFGSKKSMKLGHGEVGFKSSPPKLTLGDGRTWDLVLADLKAGKKRRLIRVKEEPDKELLAKEKASVLAELGLELVSEERFYVKPAAAETAEPQASR